MVRHSESRVTSKIIRNPADLFDAPPRPVYPSGGWTTLLHLAYDVILTAVLILGLPYFLFRLATSRRYRTGLRQRFGFVPVREAKGPCLWIHGVSVGEVKAAGPLIQAMKERFAGVELVLSATTPTGYALAKRLYPDLLTVYYPLDFSFAVKRAFRRLRPGWVVLMELEIWPNLLRHANRHGVAVAVVNGRISSRSYRGYRKLQSFLPQFSRIGHYCVQNATYRERFLSLGVDEGRISITGNVKFDNLETAPGETGDADLARTCGVDYELPVIVAGSTHSGEEAAAWRAFQELSRRGHETRWILAPRHPERVPELVAELRELGASPVRLTELRAAGRGAGSEDLVVVDTIGELEQVYALATLVFVGGSLVPTGGHNMLEPAALGKAVVFGPHTFNFEAETELVLSRAAAFQVEDEEGMVDTLARLLADRAEIEAVGERAIAAIRENGGATDRTLEALERHVFGRRLA